MKLAQNPTFRLVMWLAAWPQLGVCLLVALVVGSSLAVVYSAHETRQMYAQLQSLQNSQDFLEYERLLLEQSAWADYSRVDQVSRAQLGMASPGSDNLIVVAVRR